MPLALPLLPLYLILVGVFLGIMLVWITCAHLWRKWRLTLDMRRRKRQLSWSSLEATLRSGNGGTLIVNFNSLGWNLTDIWWTSERVADAAAAAQLVIPRSNAKGMTDEEFRAWLSDTAFDQWCASRYLSNSGASALLIKSTISFWGRGRNLKQVALLQQQFPALMLVNISTGKELEAL